MPGLSMGAGTSNPKRSIDECLSLYRERPSLNSPDCHISKKMRFSSMQQSPDRRVVSSNSTVARLARYPELTPQLHREVHAPCGTLKWGKPRRNREKDITFNFVGHILSNNYHKAKSRALGALKFFKKDKKVIKFDAETENNRVNEDSSVEEVEVIEDGREWHSVVSEPKSPPVNGVVVNAQEPDVKILDVRNQPTSSSAVTGLTHGDVNVDNAEKMLDALSLNHDVSDLSVYKKLLEDAGQHDPTLSNIDFQIQLLEKRLSNFRSLRTEKKPVKDLVPEPLVPLTREEEDEVKRAFLAHRRKVLVTHENSNIEITGELLQCLRPGQWLNDEVINLYLELLKERENREPQKFLKCHFFSTFFYKKLINGRGGYDYKSVRRWTSQRKLGYGLIDCDKIFVPIHKDIHWCLAVINRKEEKFQYLDSLRGRDFQVLKILARYFVDEVKDKNGKEIEVSSWTQEFVDDLPEQMNGFDCGVFMIKYADFYSRGLRLCFDQEHLPYFRLRTAKEILKLRAD